MFWIPGMCIIHILINNYLKQNSPYKTLSDIEVLANKVNNIPLSLICILKMIESLELKIKQSKRPF